MRLEAVAHYNSLSPDLRKKLEEKIKGFGKAVRYKFDISKHNPDPDKYNGEIVWPNTYTLDPCVWTINDPHETDVKAKSKKIAFVDETDDKGLPSKFRKIRVKAVEKGVLVLNVEDDLDHFYLAMALELHPKLKGGMFEDKKAHQVVSRIDEISDAKNKREERSARSKARLAAESLSNEELVAFVDAMQWDSGEPDDILRNKVEELAEENPVFFNDLVGSENLKTRATIKQALDKQIITFDPVEWKFMWASNMQVIAVLSPSENQTHIEKLAEWIKSNGDTGKKVFEKISGILKPVKQS